MKSFAGFVITVVIVPKRVSPTNEWISAELIYRLPHSLCRSKLRVPDKIVCASHFYALYKISYNRITVSKLKFNVISYDTND